MKWNASIRNTRKVLRSQIFWGARVSQEAFSGIAQEGVLPDSRSFWRPPTRATEIHCCCRYGSSKFLPVGNGGNCSTNLNDSQRLTGSTRQASFACEGCDASRSQFLLHLIAHQSIQLFGAGGFGNLNVHENPKTNVRPFGRALAEYSS